MTTPTSNKSKWAGLLNSRPFWALLIGVIFLIASYYHPAWLMFEQQALEIVVVLAAYIAAEFLENATGRPASELFASRKFWAAVVAILVVFIKWIVPDFPVYPEEMTTLIYLLATYIFGTGVSDAGQAITNLLRARNEQK